MQETPTRRWNGQILWKTQTTNFTQEEINNLTSSLSIKDIEFVIKNLPTKKTSCPNNFPGGFYQTLKKEIISVLHKLFQRIEEE